MSDKLEALHAARALLSDESKWAKRFFGFTKEGSQVFGSHTEACKFCALGALQNVCIEPGANGFGQVYFHAVSILQSSLDDYDYGITVAEYNDQPERTHAEILALYDRAIAKLEAA